MGKFATRQTLLSPIPRIYTQLRRNNNVCDFAPPQRSRMQKETIWLHTPQWAPRSPSQANTEPQIRHAQLANFSGCLQLANHKTPLEPACARRSKECLPMAVGPISLRFKLNQKPPNTVLCLFNRGVEFTTERFFSKRLVHVRASNCLAISKKFPWCSWREGGKRCAMSYADCRWKTAIGRANQFFSQ